MVAIVTPMMADGGLDWPAWDRLLDFHLREGSDGIVVAGTTGESPVLSVDEVEELTRRAVDRCRGKVKVIVGAGTHSTAGTVARCRALSRLGADALLLVTPYYNKPGQAGVLHHFRQVVAVTGTPVVLYDVPGRTGTQISLETFEQIKGDTVVAVKDAVGDFARGVELMQLGYAVYSGDDIANLGWLAHGASGVISVVGHVAGRQLRSMIEDFLDGNTVAALKTYQRLLPATRAIMGVPNYGATTAKACLQLLGVLDNRNVRGPLVPLTDDEVAALRAGLEASQLL
jgi:4-hydroxy-tetrahydrodipicolinate synthase